jgi:hypothetical protein
MKPKGWKNAQEGFVQVDDDNTAVDILSLVLPQGRWSNAFK